MKIAIATVQTPFLHGGADFHALNLKRALVEAGHEVEIVATPFAFSPLSKVVKGVDVWKGINFDEFDHPADHVIALKFPAYHCRATSKVVWLMHQHRAVYELANTPYGELIDSPDKIHNKELIWSSDKEVLSNGKVFANSNTVADRLKRYLGVSASTLYHPPPLEKDYLCGEVYPYVFYPSRFSSIKRQNLLLQAMQHTRTPVVSVICGHGDVSSLYTEACNLGVEKKVVIMGPIEQERKIRYYSHSLGVFYGPYEEDFGYVTLEAMLSGKPVITCQDSGGPTEFIENEVNGYIVEPNPLNVAEVIDMLWTNSRKAVEMGANGRQRYLEMDISWQNVVDSLLRGVM